MGNSYKGFVEDDEQPRKQGRTKAGTVKVWTGRSVCAELHKKQLEEVHTRLSKDGREIGKYAEALKEVYDSFSEEEKKGFEETATEWNTQPLSEELQRKLVVSILFRLLH